MIGLVLSLFGGPRPLLLKLCHQLKGMKEGDKLYNELVPILETYNL